MVLRRRWTVIDNRPEGVFTGIVAMEMDRSYETAEEACRVYFLPNLFTAGNLFFGFLAILRFIQAKYGSLVGHSPVDYYTQGAWLVVLAAAFDLLDGRIARSSGRTSLFGAEFDSLADLVSFGMAPALLVFFLILSPSTGNYPDYVDSLFVRIGWLVGFVYLLCCAGRLARFNVLTLPILPRKEKHCTRRDSVGLPVPAAAGLIVAIAVILVRAEVSPAVAVLLLPLMLLLSFLMVSTIRFPVFKHITWNFRTGFFSFLGVVILCALLLFCSVYAIAIVFFSYLFYGLIRCYFRLQSGKK
ncbi:MAG: phosphatidylcholine/phosphatidylserine synthase [Puniceicoccales bacterium]|jgi:CDP-diacylglycerol--serine O-phosphatidyltransferase|nr:phosphatidylcholine/phosphatidylserine synthase [Puniceicoccales bacterium]